MNPCSRESTGECAPRVVQENKYDYKFRRTQRVERLDADGDPLPAPRCTTFVYDQFDRLIAEHDCSSGSDPDAVNNVLAEYVYLEGYHVLAVRRDGDDWYWYLNDHLPTPKKLVDASRVVVWDGKMEPFGETESPGATVEQPLCMPGQVLDSATAMFYSGNRYIEPGAGRFLSPDPLQSSSVTNDPRSVLAVIPQWRALMMRQSVTVQSYGTARSNPLRYTDPTGMQVECVNRLLCDPGDQWRPPWELYDVDWAALSSTLDWFIPTPCQLGAAWAYLACVAGTAVTANRGSCPSVCSPWEGVPQAYAICVADCSIASTAVEALTGCADLAAHFMAECGGT